MADDHAKTEHFEFIKAFPQGRGISVLYVEKSWM